MNKAQTIAEQIEMMDAFYAQAFGPKTRESFDASVRLKHSKEIMWTFGSCNNCDYMRTDEIVSLKDNSRWVRPGYITECGNSHDEEDKLITFEEAMKLVKKCVADNETIWRVQVAAMDKIFDFCDGWKKRTVFEHSETDGEHEVQWLFGYNDTFGFSAGGHIIRECTGYALVNTDEWRRIYRTKKDGRSDTGVSVFLSFEEAIEDAKAFALSVNQQLRKETREKNV